MSIHHQKVAAALAGVGDSEPHQAAMIHRKTSSELLAGARELVIEHAGEEYRLRLTSQGKLILTK